MPPSYLIIAGTTKSGTTSVYNYLADHPQICASRVKETRFFLDADYPVQGEVSLEPDGLPAYEALFEKCPERPVRMEATPDYLYSPGSIQRIRSALGPVKLIFLLREPVARMVSWYRYAAMRGGLSETIPFETFVCQQLDGVAPRTQAFMSLEQGRYTHYLQPYLEAFGRENIFIGFLEDLERDPLDLMRQIARFGGLSPEFYDTYAFEQFNRSETLKNPGLFSSYLFIKRALRRFTQAFRFHSYLRRIRMAFETRFLALNKKQDPQQATLSAQVRARLDEYYRAERLALAGLLGRPLPWP